MFEAIISSNPGFWGSARKELLQKLLSVMEPANTLSQAQLDDFIRKEQGDYHSREWLKRLATVLESMLYDHQFDVVIPPVPVTLPRPSILPVKAEEFAWLDACCAMRDTLWSEWFAAQSQDQNLPISDVLIFGLAHSMATDIGMHAVQIIDAISSLKPSDILDGGQRIKVSIHPRDKFPRYSIIALPPSTQLLLHSLLYNRKNMPGDSYLLTGKPFPKLKGRRTRARLLINRHYQSLRDLTMRKQPDIPYPSNWPSFCRMAHLIAFYEGVEPFMITALRRYPLPVSHPIESTLPLTTKEAVDRPSPLTLLGQSVSVYGSTKSMSTPPRTEKPEIDTEMDWCGRSKTILRKLVAQLKTVGKKKIKQPGQKAKALRFIEQSIQAADGLEPNQKSALHLALFWMRNYLGNHDITASTIDAYFKRAFINGLLDFGDSYDLRGWDAEDHELAIEAMLDRPRLGEKSKQDIIDVLKKVYPFAEKNGFCDNVNINFSIDGWIASSTRPEMIGLHRFDALTRILMQSNSRHDLEKAAALILGFYGGLRSSEVSRLTMNDVVSLDGELNVEIHNSKSPAGRRRVPLHMLAPADACKTVEKLYENRLSEFREKSISRQLILKNIPLFGPNRSRDHYTSRYLANTCIAELKKYMGMDFVFHSLRHSFASWLLLRWYAARYPELVDDLI